MGLARTCLLALAALCAATPAVAAPRSKRVAPPQQAVRLLPAAEAPRSLDAPVLSGLDYSAVAPAGFMLRVIEDEPFIYAQGDSARARRRFDQGFSAIQLIGLLDDGGRYEARILLREAHGDYAGQLLDSFDQAVHGAYVHAATASETRDLAAYRLSELRSPLGLAASSGSQRNSAPQREYLAYDAEVANPLSEADFANLSTPYRHVSGVLQAAWPAGRNGVQLLSVEFTADRYPHSLTLTENLARCVVNRVRAAANSRERLEYLAYHPEFELPGLNALWAGKNIDSRTADLAERPGEGAGFDAQPIQGDLCPQYLGEGPAWPAQPYRDWEFIRTLQRSGQALPRCSHCLLDSATEAQRRRQSEEERRRVEQERRVPGNSAAPPADGSPKRSPDEHTEFTPAGPRTTEPAACAACRGPGPESEAVEPGCGIAHSEGRLIHAPRGKARATAQCGSRDVAERCGAQCGAGAG